MQSQSGWRSGCALLLSGIYFIVPMAAIAAEWIALDKALPAELFGEKCGMCHRDGGMGTGILGRRLSAEQALLESRRDLQPASIETAVRNGIGIMFPISRGELSDPQLHVLIDYLVSDSESDARVRSDSDASEALVTLAGPREAQ